MAKKRKKKKNLILHKISPTRGSITFKVLIGIVILGSIAFVSGIFPKNQISPIDPNGPKYKPIASGEAQLKKSLQLKTIKFEACSQTVAVEMVLDRSGSMQIPTIQKMRNLQSASLFFVSKLTDDAPIGIVSFSDTVREELPITTYKDVKPRVESIINGLKPGGNTHTREALMKAKEALAIGIPKFPGRQFSLILVTDGVPNNPGNEENPVPIANEIKNLGVKIYVIGITQGVAQRAIMINLMTAVASPNGFFEAPDTTTLNDLYNKIGFEICNTAG